MDDSYLIFFMENKGEIVAGGNGWGNELNQLARPLCLCVNNDETVYVSDHLNNRIMEWRNGSTSGRIFANDLQGPLQIVIEKQPDCFLVCDYFNRRIVRCSSQGNTETILSDVNCTGLALDDKGYMYVADQYKHEVRKWKIGEHDEGILVAGGNGNGDRLDQLFCPRNLVIDRNESLYIFDCGNQRIVKWDKNARQGHPIVTLWDIGGIAIDRFGDFYFSDRYERKIINWTKNTQFNITGIASRDLCFDRYNHLYVLDYDNQRVVKFHSTENL